MVGAAFTDPFLGPVAWDGENGWWTFDGGMPDGPPVVCYLLAAKSPPAEDCLEHARQVVRWLRENERALRRKVALAMIDWVTQHYIREPGKDEEDTLEKVEPFMHVLDVEFIETRPARIEYATTKHLAQMSSSTWGGGVAVAVDRTGGVARGPEFANSWVPERFFWRYDWAEPGDAQNGTP
jgi:hypothetical protein